jgi:hypothetical protein
LVGDVDFDLNGNGLRERRLVRVARCLATHAVAVKVDDQDQVYVRLRRPERAC